jgi:hypothetical protein
VDSWLGTQVGDAMNNRRADNPGTQRWYLAYTLLRKKGLHSSGVTLHEGVIFPNQDVGKWISRPLFTICQLVWSALSDENGIIRMNILFHRGCDSPP